LLLLSLCQFNERNVKSLIELKWGLTLKEIMNRSTVEIWLSPNSITPTLRQSPGQVRDIIADFHDLCLRLSLRGSFGESLRNGIWALLHSAEFLQTLTELGSF